MIERKNRLKLLLLQGGQSGEHEVSLNSGRMVAENLGVERYEVTICTIQKDGRWSFPDQDQESLPTAQALAYISEQGFGVAFIALHGSFGEDGRIQSLLESILLPYTGSGPMASAIAMDKAASSALLKYNGFSVPDFVSIRNGEEVIPPDLFPAIVKPCHGGSSVGISKATNKEEANKAIEAILASGDFAIVQKLIVGREITCGILNDEVDEPICLPPTEIIPKNSEFFDYNAKYTPGASQEITPANLSDNETKLVQNLALRAHQIIGCSGMSRSDFILSGDTFYILEINTIPGLTPTSLLPQEASAAGIKFPKILDLIIQSALNLNKN